MELTNSSLEPKDAESFVRKILNKSINVEAILQVIDEDPNWIEDNISGEISRSTLLEMLEFGSKNKNYNKLLISTIDIIEGKTIDDLVFKTILHYPNNDLRDRMLISLAHKKLKESQLRQLCNMAVSFECFFELAITYYTDRKYPLKSLKDFIEEIANGKYAYIVEDLAAELANFHIASSKTKYAYVVRILKSKGQ